jgi:hypothetical protein
MTAEAPCSVILVYDFDIFSRSICLFSRDLSGSVSTTYKISLQAENHVRNFSGNITEYAVAQQEQYYQ